jgi:hypothetical protein
VLVGMVTFIRDFSVQEESVRRRGRP